MGLLLKAGVQPERPFLTLGDSPSSRKYRRRSDSRPLDEVRTSGGPVGDTCNLGRRDFGESHQGANNAVWCRRHCAQRW